MRRTTILATLLVLALLGVGCGSDGGGDTQASTISKAEFIKRANAICRNTSKYLVDQAGKPPLALPEGSRARRQLEIELVSTVVGPAFEDEVAEIEELGAPAGDEAEIERILSLMKPAIEETKTEPETYVLGKDYRGGEEHYGEAHQLARAYGIKNCPVG